MPFSRGKKTYIGQLELVWGTSPYTTLGLELRGRRAIHFIDNISSMSALIKGYARAVDSGLVVNAFHATNAVLQVDVWFEYVRSKANVADLPSRDAWGELLRVLARMALDGCATFIPKAVMPDVSSWRAPAADWLARARAALLGPTPTIEARRTPGVELRVTKRGVSHRVCPG